MNFTFPVKTVEIQVVVLCVFFGWVDCLGVLLLFLFWVFVCFGLGFGFCFVG